MTHKERARAFLQAQAMKYGRRGVRDEEVDALAQQFAAGHAELRIALRCAVGALRDAQRASVGVSSALETAERMLDAAEGA